MVFGAIVAVGSAGFAAEFGVSLAAGGVGDMISGVRAALKGQEIKLGNWLEGKGIEIAVSLVMAGISAKFSKASEAVALGEEATKKLSMAGFGYALGMQVATSQLVSYAVAGAVRVSARPIKAEVKELEEAIKQNIHQSW